MKKILFSLLLCLFCVSITAAEYMKVGDIKTFDIGYIDHLKGCVWTISRPSNVSFVSTPGAYDTKVQVRATKEFSGDPCIVQCKYYWLEKDPIKGTYTYSRSSYKKWSIFINKSGNDGNSGGGTGGTTPNNPEDKRIKLYLCKNGKVDYSQEVTEMTVEEGESLNFWTGTCYGPHIYFRVDDTSIANIDENNYILDGFSEGTTWFHACDAGGGWANCKIIVKKRNLQNGDYVKYPCNRNYQMGFEVTDIAKKECKFSYTNSNYVPTNGTLKVPQTVFGLNVVSVGTQNSLEKIKKIVLPNSVRTIENYAFRKSKDLEEIELPSSLTEIGESAFASSPLKSIKLPSSLTEIGEYAFASSSLKSILIPEGVKNIGEGCFRSCRNLEEASLPSTLKKIPSECFGESFKLRKVTLTDGIKEIKGGAFRLTGIASIVIPASIELIDNNGLNTHSISVITCSGENPCVLKGATFWEGVTVYVPKNAWARYKQDVEWKKIPNIKAIEDKEENLYVLRPYWRDETVDARTGRIQSTGNAYQAKIKTYEGNDEFSIAQLVNDEFVAYGTKSNTPIFSDSDIKEGYASKEFPLYSMKNSNVHKFILPEGWKGDSLLVKIDKDLSRVVFVYGKKIENIEKASLPTNVSILLGREKTLKISASPNDAQITSIEWYSRNEDIATVKDGVVTALKFGEASIYCVVNGNIVSNDCKVTITNSPYYYCGNNNGWTSEPITPLEYDKARKAYVLRIPAGDYFKVIDYELFLEKNDWWQAFYGTKTEGVLSGPLEWYGESFAVPYDKKEYDFILYPSTMTYEIKPIETSGVNGESIAIKDNVSILLGREETLKISASPNDAQISSIEWYSRNEDIATVKDGVVTALKFGETSIYCVVNGNIVSNDCKVTITNSPYYYSGNKNYWTSDPITPLEYDKTRQAYVLRIPTGDNFKVIDYELFLEEDDWWLASYGPKTENVLSGPLEWCSALCFVAPDDTKEYEFILYPSTKTYEIKPIETSGINDVLMDVKDKMRIFSIEGLELRIPQKGLNIINGKKIIIK